MKKMKVRVTLIDEMLGTAPANPEVYRNYIASKAPDAKSIEEEIAALGVDELADSKMTIFLKDADGTPFMLAHQFYGFFKAACSALQRSKDPEMAEESMKLKAFKKIINDGIIIPQKKLPIDLHGCKIDISERPLRASTPQGDRVALASSERVPEGSTIDLTILCLNNDWTAAVKEWLDYGIFKGLLQWRNSGKGRFVWELLEEGDISKEEARKLLTNN